MTARVLCALAPALTCVELAPALTPRRVGGVLGAVDPEHFSATGD